MIRYRKQRKMTWSFTWIMEATDKNFFSHDIGLQVCSTA